MRITGYFLRIFNILRIHKYRIHSFYNFIGLILLLITFLIISVAWCKKYMIYLISISKFSDESSAFFLCKSYWKSFKHLFMSYYNEWLKLRWQTLATRAKSKGCEANIRWRPLPCVAIIGNIPLLKTLRLNSWP